MKPFLKILIAGTTPALLATTASEAQMLAGDPVAKPPPPAATQPATPPTQPIIQELIEVTDGIRR